MIKTPKTCLERCEVLTLFCGIMYWGLYNGEICSAGMAGQSSDSNPTDAFEEYMLLEKDPDLYRMVFSGPSQISPWIDPSVLNLKHRIGRGPFGDVWIATHHQRTEDYDRYHEVAVKMLHPIKEDQLQFFSARFDEIFSKCQGLGNVCFLHGISTQNWRVCWSWTVVACWSLLPPHARSLCHIILVINVNP